MTNTKFIARQASSINLYNNVRAKLLKCCANIYFDKHVIPKYANIKFANSFSGFTSLL